MAIFKAPRILTNQRVDMILEESEIVYDLNQKIFYGGNGVTLGGVAIGSGVGESSYFFTLNESDIDNKYVILSEPPLFPSSVSLLPLGGIPQINGIDFQIIEGNKLSWEGLGLDNFLEINEMLSIKH